MGKNADAAQKYLSEEGYRPKIDEDGDIVFKHEGDTYFIVFRDNDDDYVALQKMGRIDVEENDALAVYKLLNKVNAEYIVGKCAIREGEDSILRFEVATLDGIKNFLNNFERYLTIITQMEKEFVEGYSEA